MKRQRGRGRKGNGQANRNFESNGPGIKIRGSASHIYDKYQQLARDELSSGDRVMAENYLQHAEHYFRIVQANQKTMRDRAEAEPNTAEADSAEPMAANGADGDPLQVVTPEAGELGASDGQEQPTAERRPRRRRTNRGAANGKPADAGAEEALQFAGAEADDPGASV